MSTLQISEAVNAPSGPWLIWEPRVLDGLMALHSSIHGMEQKPSLPVAGNQGRVGVVNVSGVLTKQGSWWGSSTSQIGSVVTDMANSGLVDTIVLRIDSVGGSSAGVAEAADAIKAATQKVRVIASIEDYGASAAYYLASQASEVYANASAVVGSVGTIMVIPDGSQMFASAGIKMNVIASGKFKGMGAWGAPVSEAHIAEFQKMVNQTNEMFLSAVQSGRNLSAEAMQTIAEARVYSAKEAMNLGLIDGVASFAQVLDQATSQKDKQKMSQATTQPPVQQEAQQPTAAERDKQLQTLCKGCDAAFRLEQICANATDIQAMQAWIEKQSSVIAAAAATQQTVATQPAAPSAPVAEQAAPQVVTVAAGNTAKPEHVAATSQASVQQQWREAIAAKKSQGLRAADAISAVANEQPELAQAYNAIFKN